jgi:hypothetical protein
VTERQQLALGEPSEDLTGFPTVDATGEWYRAHTAGLGPWWFSHDGSGRFDLEPPYGTCYLASGVDVAVRERLGETLVGGRMISAEAADKMVVSRLEVDDDDPMADTTRQEATRYGVTRELGTTTPYDLPRRWAAALHAHGMGGLRYWPRFSLDGTTQALALFDRAGHDDGRTVDPEPMSGRAAAAMAGIEVLGPPRSVPIRHL